jgi:hypothetical protein
MNQSPDTFANKHPAADRPATIDWSVDLAPGDVITSSVWEVEGPDAELTTHSGSFTDTKTSIWLAAGTVDKQYKLTNTVTTSPNPPKTLVAVKLVNIRVDAK